MNTYETVLIASSKLADNSVLDLQKKIETVLKKHQGKITQWDDWGNRKLSYKIKKEHTGHYVCMNYTASPTVIRELEQSLEFNEDILKYLTLRLKGEKQ